MKWPMWVVRKRTNGDGRATDPPLQIEIFDINGRIVFEMPVGEGLVSSRVSGDHKGRPYETVWQPDESLGSGIYLIRARFDRFTDRGSESVTKRIVYLK
ncbi:hypothetical protein DRQ36_06300 [bacterium]|nr:MAG: hypothetical protein DRQ36_06300 [bacterium]